MKNPPSIVHCLAILTALIWAGVITSPAADDLRHRCAPERLTKSEHDLLRSEIRKIKSAKERLLALQELQQARDTIVWQTSFVEELAHRHEQTGKLKTYLAQLGARATDPDISQLNRAHAALHLSIVCRDMLDGAGTRRWGELAVKEAPLSAVDFWSAGISHLREANALGEKFYRHAMTDPEIDGAARMRFLSSITTPSLFADLASRWLEEKPEELPGALSVVCNIGWRLPREPIIRALERLPENLDSRHELSVRALRAELELKTLSEPHSEAALWGILEQARGMHGATPLGSAGWSGRPEFAAGKEELLAHLHPRWGSNVRQIRLKCLTSLVKVDGDGSKTAARLLAEPDLIHDTMAGARMLYYSAAQLHRLMADELEAHVADAKERSMDERLAPVELLGAVATSSHTNSRNSDISWRLRVLDALLVIARQVCAEEPEQIKYFIKKIHGEIAERFGMNAYVQPALTELFEAWQVTTPVEASDRDYYARWLADPEGGYPTGKIPSGLFLSKAPLQISRGQLVYEGLRHRLSSYLRADSQRQVGRFKKIESGRKPASFPRSSLSNPSSVGLLGLDRSNKGQRPLLSEALSALPYAKSKEEQVKALADLRRAIGDSEELAAFELFAAESFIDKSETDWKLVKEIVQRRIWSDDARERVVADHLTAVVALFADHPARDSGLRVEEFNRANDKQMSDLGLPKGLTIQAPYELGGGSGEEPDCDSEPGLWLRWASRTLGDNTENAKLQLARKMLSIPARSMDERGVNKFYASALRVLSDTDGFAELTSKLQKAAKTGDQTAALVLLTAASARFIEMNPVEAAERVLATEPDSYGALHVVLTAAINRGDDSKAAESWQALAEFHAFKGLSRDLYQSPKLSDRLLIDLCKSFRKTQAPATPQNDWEKNAAACGSILAAELLTREATREVGMKILGEMFPQRIREFVVLRLPWELKRRSATEPVYEQVARDLLWPFGLPMAGLHSATGEEAWRQNRLRIRAVYPRSEANEFTFSEVFKEVDTRGDLEPLHQLAKRGITAGSRSDELLWFDLYASIQREPESDRVFKAVQRIRDRSYAQAAKHSPLATREREAEKADELLLQKVLPLVPDKAQRTEILFKLLRGKREAEVSGVILYAGIAAAEAAGDLSAAAVFRHRLVEKTVATGFGSEPSQLMSELIRDGSIQDTKRLYETLLSRCREEEALITRREGHALVHFLDHAGLLSTEDTKAQIRELIELGSAPIRGGAGFALSNKNLGFGSAPRDGGARSHANTQVRADISYQ